ncbi:hypothetical protein ACFQI7_09045 [Paenibacillus allorhizosphaerae]|uniref:hypothetical protein n=1 Tax=Paenibacillus allorhizosphaerae TaxID=2849866 RepID=UPI001C4034D6|nr:hypothetical protein [Paenibacillus allorhizosphaerae]
MFNWRTGMPDIDYGAFAFGPDGTTHGPHTTFRLGQVKDGEHICCGMLMPNARARSSWNGNPWREQPAIESCTAKPPDNTRRR